MPNYVSHIVTFKGDENRIKELAESVKSSKCEFDFDKIYPMPVELDTNSSGMGDLGMNYLIAINKPMPSLTSEEKRTIKKVESDNNKDEIIELGKKYLKNIAEYGSPTWYQWCIKNWGTKWNSCDSRFENGAFRFNTAWSTCWKLIEKLSEKFPDIEINVKYADEDRGYNAGEYTFLNGNEIFSRVCEGESDEAIELYELTHK